MIVIHILLSITVLLNDNYCLVNDSQKNEEFMSGKQKGKRKSLSIEKKKEENDSAL